MVSARFGSPLTLLAIGVCLLHPILAGDDEGKEKKIIIKVPQIIKHIHHHHVKKVHVYEEKPKKELHYGPFHHTLSSTKDLGGWTSEYKGISTEGAWKLPNTLDGWNNYFKKELEGDSKSSEGTYEGGEAWKENDDSYGWKGGEDWTKNWAGEKLSSGLSGGFESNVGGGYNDDSHVMYELPSGVGSPGKFEQVHEENSFGDYGENSFEGGYGGNYKLHKRENRGLQLATHLKQYMGQGTMKQPELEHVYESSEDNKQRDWIHGLDVPTSKQNRHIANLGQILLMQNTDNPHLSAYLNGQVMQGNSDWMPFNEE